MISAQLWGDGYNLVVIIILMLFASASLLKTAVSEASGRSPFRKWVIEPLFGLFAGWLTLATCLNAGSVVRDTFGIFGLSPVVFAAAVLILAGLGALAITVWTRGSWWYSGAVIWGLIAVIAANIGAAGSVEMIFLSVGLIAAAGVCTHWVR